MRKTKKCSWCGEPTVQCYVLKDGGFLCYDCACKHYDSVDEAVRQQIFQMERSLSKKMDKLRYLKKVHCTHDRIEDTGYVRRMHNGKMYGMYRCNGCNMIMYKK